LLPKVSFTQMYLNSYMVAVDDGVEIFSYVRSFKVVDVLIN